MSARAGAAALTLVAAAFAPAAGAQQQRRQDAPRPAGAPPPVLVVVTINPESRVKADRTAPGAPPAALRAGGWTAFRVQVRNEARVTAFLRVTSANAPSAAGRRDRWLDLRLEPAARLTGRPEEWRTLWLRSRDEGMREARLTFDVGQGTQDMGFRSDVALLFRCRRGGE
ncbi:MAG TPA: hypothetical protein VM490_11670 [Armatimonadaceae bacterium]|nr:hypothetical protein [Armatimonadaceae bacterium]